jgi:outer membrane protein
MRSISLFLAALSLPIAATAAAPQALTLESALSTAETANLNVLLSREALTQAGEFVNQQRVGLLPTVTASGQQRRTEGVSISNGVASQNELVDRFDGKFAGSVPVIAPERFSAMRAARAGVSVAQADYQSTVQGTLSLVAQTYFTHLRNLRRIEVLNANIERAQALLDLARNQVNAGIATRIDVTRAEAQLAQTQQARLQQDTIVYQSALQLERLLGLDPTSELRLADFSVRRVAEPKFPLGLERTTFERRADWIRAQKAVEQAKLDVRSAKYQRLPSLSLSGEYGIVSPNVGDRDREEAWFAGAVVSVPVFDGLKSGADRRIALSRQRGQELRLQNLEIQIAAELRLAVQDAGSRYAQIGVAEKSLQLGEEQLRLARQRYEQGVADNREITEAQNNLAIASDALVEAIYQYNLSRVELARSKGDVRGILTEKVQ